jgi:hypothetical protein
VFACAVDWPGWCRSGRDADAAVTALAGYAPRYATVADEAGIVFPVDVDAADLDVVERIDGTGATDFGVPDKVPDVDREPLDEALLQRYADVLGAAWRVFDRVVADAPPVLRKGPRGGGRDRDDIVRHVAEAERSYARSIGVGFTPTQFATQGGQDALRAQIITALRDGSRSAPIVERGWPARYAARRIAWHVLDHAWEIEDKGDVEQPARAPSSPSTATPSSPSTATSPSGTQPSPVAPAIGSASASPVTVLRMPTSTR